MPRRDLFLSRPRAREYASWFIEAVSRIGLAPLRLRHTRPPRSATPETGSLGEFNRSAETYFVRADRSHLLDKPFSEPNAFGRRLIELGTLLDAARIRPGDVVLELGAGSCWVSHLLNRIGCRTISVDVSKTALDIGHERFRRDPAVRWDLRPAFVVYDGQHLPLASHSVDAIVLYDVFHHVPNPRQLLPELRRVLTPDGVVAMSEPGRGHASSLPSLNESQSSGVLEAELVLEDVAEDALACGFRDVRCVISPNRPVYSVPAREFRPFMSGKGFGEYWLELCAAIDSHYFLLLYPGSSRATTARPSHLKAAVSSASRDVKVRHGVAWQLPVDIQNCGDTVWLASPDASGWTRIGAHLYGADFRVIDYDWVRASLPRDIDPRGAFTAVLTMPPIPERGTYHVAVDLVVEGVTWFGEIESQPLFVRCEVA